MDGKVFLFSSLVSSLYYIAYWHTSNSTKEGALSAVKIDLQLE
ncbi:hypothetical protein [Shimazuella alba]|nr:hypothetical protein [Shimazuella alba]